MFRLLSRLIAVFLATCISIDVLSVNAVAEMTGDTTIKETISNHGESFVLAEEQSENTELLTLDSSTEQPTVSVEEETMVIEELSQSEDESDVWLTVDTNKIAKQYTDFSAKYFANILMTHGDYSEEAIVQMLTEDDNGVTLKISENDVKVLSLLSRTIQGNVTLGETSGVFNYVKWTLNCFQETTGVIYLPDDFKGLGDNNYPFAGTLFGPGVTFVIKKTLFKALDATAVLNGKDTKRIQWKGTADQAILADVLYVDGDDHEIQMPLEGSKEFCPYIGTLTPKEGVENPGKITLPSLNYTLENTDISNYNRYSGNAGLLCGTMSANTKVSFAGPLTLSGNTVTVTGTGDVGALVGQMENGAQLTISSDTTITSNLNGSDVGGLVGSMSDNSVLTISNAIILTNQITGSNNAGGLVGTMGMGSKIDLNANVTIAKAGTESEPVTNQITATNSAGGIVGELTTDTGSITVSGDSKIVLNDSDSKITGTANAGGLYGKCTASGNLDPYTGVVIGQSIIPEIKVGTTNVSNYSMSTVMVGGTGSTGGLFGTLHLNGTGNKCIIENKSLYVKAYSANETSSVGGLVGTLNGINQNALVIRFDAGTDGSPSTNPQVIVNTKPNDTLQKPKYLGGLVAYQNATVDATNVFAGFPYASQSYHSDGVNYYTGGLSAYVCDNMLLITDNTRIIFSGYTDKDHNGGVAGYTGKKSIVYVKNKLLLRDCPLQSVAGCGQIVSKQDCSLIYGPGVPLTRWGQGMEVDDIGNYGEMYRIPDFITISDNYSVTFARALMSDSNTGAYILNDTLDYACLALAWQSRGEFGTVSGIDSSNWDVLKTSKITLGDDIDLTGMGIGGLSRDVYSDEDTYRGIFDGSNHSLKLDIGAINSQKGANSGDGRIYFHNSTGLFAGLSSAAIVQNVKLSGSIHVSNNRLSVDKNDETANMKSGALAGVFLCEDNQVSLSNVSTDINILADSKTQTINAPFYIGGLFGLVYGDGSCQITLNGHLGPTISHVLTENDKTIIGQCFHTGGAIGAVDSTAKNLQIICDGVVISGKIERTNDAAENFYAGGLIGTIFPSESSARSITLRDIRIGQKASEGVDANPFILSGEAELRMGGVLGGIWADTDVTVSGLTVEDATITASGAAKLGGLVYRASGKWNVSYADLSGLSINAPNAEALGLMVCQGGTYREPLIYDAARNGENTYLDVGGLYLVMTEHWETGETGNTGYKVPVNGNITFNQEGKAYDEFVAYTAYAYFTEADKNNPQYSITSNQSGVISLKTDNNTVNMSNGDSNTYTNRTDIEKKSNLYSRYYYNLDEVIKGCDAGADNKIDKPQELLMWAVYRYTASNIKKHFSFDGVETISIGGNNADQRATFDMDGLSYYPLKINDSSVTVQFADIKFYNQEIESKVTTEKSTRLTAADHTQHYTMQCGLFLDFVAEKNEYPNATNYTMIINGVTFSGTIGKVNGQSGALLCGTVSGKYSGNTAKCNVVLASVDNPNNAVILNGICVDSEDDYRPVLIGTIWEYASLQANYITTSEQQSMAAGSSLIGNVGYSAAAGLSLTFSGTIKLPSEETNVFTKATLLNSLQYQGNTPATYQFNKNKDWSGTDHIYNVTYGYEISGSVEFLEEQLWYFDGGYISSTSASADQQSDFSHHLPYVAHSPAKNGDNTYTIENGYHELEINVKPADLLQGCGTYGDPYILDSEKLLKSIAKYLEHPEKTINGWKIKYPSYSEYHTSGSDDTTLVFNSVNQNWSNDKTIQDIQTHLTNAYYVIEKNMNLVSFSGLGTEDCPFSGVIQGKDDTILSITMSGTTQALIRYSNGSVVRNLKILLSQNVSLRSSEPEILNSNRTASRAPKNFFGGVIGCVMGGDNIIENVSVIVPENKKPYSFSESFESFEHLVPIGGYVGVIAGGGVLFRGTISEGLSNDDTISTSRFMYRNPIVGRVLNGYAFYEGNRTTPNNTDKNYKINNITEGDHLSWDENTKTVTVKDSEGLLTLSAIISSGAGSFENSLSYKTGYGVSRNAKYDQIGKNEETAGNDYLLANNTTPYLLQREGISVSLLTDGNQSGISVKIDANLNMSAYGNGYRGLSARYVSNAGFTKDTGTNSLVLSPFTVVVRLSSFNGNNKTISGINMDVREYDDDDFHVASIGGILNIAWTNKDTGGNSNSVLAENLTLNNCSIELKYIDKNGDDVHQSKNQYFTQTDGISTVAVGGFIGTVNNLSNSGMTSIASNYLFKNIRIEAASSNPNSIYGPNSAGGLIGATGMGSNGYPGKLLTNGSTVRFSPSFLNCSYSNINITGYLAAGGLVGCSATGYDNLTSFGTAQDGYGSGAYATCTITNEKLVFASNSTVQTLASGGICGGVFGGIGIRGLINDSSVDSLTGLSIVSNQSVSLLRFENVKLYADLAFDNHVYCNTTTINGVDNGKTIAVGGCIGRISHANPVRIFKVQMGVTNAPENERCNIQIKQSSSTAPSNPQVTAKYAGGLVGYGYTTREMVIQDCDIYSTDISGDTAGGFVSLARLSTLTVSDSILKNCNIDCITRAGGIAGYSEAEGILYNCQLMNTAITKAGQKNDGNVARLIVQVTNKTINAAGISVFAESNSIYLPDKDISGSYTGYVAYADYLAETTNHENAKEPYVTVNPCYQLPLTDGTNIKLYGDAIKGNGDYISIGDQIWNYNHASGEKDSQAEITKNYTKYSAVTNIYKPNVTSLHSAIGEGPSDLPVLLVKGGDSKAITDYLDVITNGGYTSASQDTVDKVTFRTTVYYLNQELNAFSTDNWDVQHTGVPAVTTDESGKKLVVSGTSYDNTRHRFTLVEATFSTSLGTYTVSIPVVVQRKLEYVYMATLSYGTEFNAESYKTVDSHLLESYQVPFSAYLTIRYNQAYNNNTNSIETAEYDWKSYIEGGGNLLTMDKTLTFTEKLPPGTQFTLVDCQHGNQAYYYCDRNENTGVLSLSSFKKGSSDGNSSFQFSMADVLGIRREDSSNANGTFTKLTDSEEATIVINGEYFRKAKETDEKELRYNLVYPENLSNAVVEENYYLVITVNQKVDTPINGILRVGLMNYNIPTNGVKIRRFNAMKDDEKSTESTYSISSGYRQGLTTSEPRSPVNLNDANNKMHIEMTDTITFSRDQAYGSKDLLYLRFSASLSQKKGDDTVDKGIPAGTSGTVVFHVQDTDGNYYVRSGDGWVKSGSSDNSENQACSYNWTADGGILSLVFSEDGSSPIDLSGVRNLIYENNAIEPKIIVSASMKEDITPVYSAEDDVIPSSKDGLDNYVRLHYTAQISTQARSINYSTTKAIEYDETHYYRYQNSLAVLSMDAVNIDQLGVNPLQPVENYKNSNNNASCIDLNVSLDLSDLQNNDSILQNADSITFRLSLKRRNDSEYEIVENPSEYITFDEFVETQSGDWEWTIQKDSEQWNLILIGEQFSIPVKAYVFTDQKKYANYKIVVNTVLSDGEGNSLLSEQMVDTNDANVIYTYACIKPTFYTFSS